MDKKLKHRNEVEENFKWKIEDLVKTDKDFETRLKSVLQRFSELEKFKNNLNISNLYECLNLKDSISSEVMTLYVYANLKFNEDTTNGVYQKYSNSTDYLISTYQACISFIEPEILNIKEEDLLKALETSEALRLYSHYLKNILRNKAHVLSQKEENLLANAYELTKSPDNIFSMLNNADIKFQEIQNSEGKSFNLTHGNYSSFLESNDRTLRENAFKSYYSSYYSLKNTITSIYLSGVKSDIFLAFAKKYNSSLEHSLSETNIPVSVYKNLIEIVNKYLPVMHKYMAIRKRALKLEDLHFYDIYKPIVKKVDMKIPFEEAKDIVLKALAPLGSEYVNTLKEIFENRWIDIYENIGKRSGAYVWGAYSCHPFVSLNYADNISSLFTLVHELGHAMHSHYTQTSQPYVYGDYTIFLAEIASTVNEALLMEYLLETTKDENEKLYLLNYFIEQFRTTLFRQTMFAEFELIVHDNLEKGISQNFESLCEIYKNLNSKYYGKEIIQDEEVSWEWVRIPHFYNSFYVYQYATGYSYAIAFSQNILKDEKHRNKYIEFLKSGSSNYSSEILKNAGLDINKNDSIENAMKVFEKLVNEIEKTL